MHKILVIEDNRTMCDGMREILELEGYHVDSSYSGKEGIEKLQNSAYDLVICDMKLGDISGLEVLAFHQQENMVSKFIIATAFGNIELAVKCIKKGAHDFVAKPFSPDVLRQKVRNCFVKA